jgi:hypothetical protein
LIYVIVEPKIAEWLNHRAYMKQLDEDLSNEAQKGEL